ncbi:MAG TPA: hypothetical protein VMT89_04205 [Candidatus Acidoferrales bacterium]|nr:hypothetical protein [Candidatus Acidoferrales bacterium]
MASFTNYAQNKIIDNLFRGQSNSLPATFYVALIAPTKGYWSASTTYSSGDTIIPTGGNGHIYKCTTAGTSGSSAPSWNTGTASTTSDGTAVWTEQTTAINGGTFPEAAYTGYARISVASSLANWAGTQGAGTTVASSGSSGTTSNNNAITFGAPTSGPTIIFGVVLMDASSSGNAWTWGSLSVSKTLNNGDAAPSFPAAALSQALS